MSAFRKKMSKQENIEMNREKYDFRSDIKETFRANKGIGEEVVRLISKDKNEPKWMLEKRLYGLKRFNEMEMPKWGADLSKLDLDEISYYVKSTDVENADSWDKVPDKIKETFEKLGIPQAEREILGGSGAQFESTVVYHNLKKDIEAKGVIFENLDVALKKYPELVKEYFMTKCVPIGYHKFAALHAAVWSGGTFIHVPKGVKVELPIQAYFRMNAQGMGQFEHTLIIVEPGAELTYIEACSAPRYSANSLHAGCVEIIVKEGARMRYLSIENWSHNTYNLNTKLAVVEKNGIMEWINGNLGSGVTMLYPTSVLKGENAKSNFLGIAFASTNQNQDTGSKVYHLAPKTTSTIISKSISKDGGITTYRGLVKIAKNATGCRSNVECDALMIGKGSVSNTIPYIEIATNKSEIGHEARVGKIGDNEIFYLMSRGLNREEAVQMIVSGFIEPIAKELPLEYAVELNQLIRLEMEGSVG